MTDVIRHGRQEPLLPGATARPWSPVHEECDREIEQAERDLGEALALLDKVGNALVAVHTSDNEFTPLVDLMEPDLFDLVTEAVAAYSSRKVQTDA